MQGLFYIFATKTQGHQGLVIFRVFVSSWLLPERPEALPQGVPTLHEGLQCLLKDADAVHRLRRRPGIRALQDVQEK